MQLINNIAVQRKKREGELSLKNVTVNVIYTRVIAWGMNVYERIMAEGTKTFDELQLLLYIE